MPDPSRPPLNRVPQEVAARLKHAERVRAAIAAREPLRHLLREIEEEGWIEDADVDALEEQRHYRPDFDAGFTRRSAVRDLAYGDTRAVLHIGFTDAELAEKLDRFLDADRQLRVELATW